MFTSYRRISWLVVILAALTMLPFLGATEFFTKGEPREAIVAVSMVDDGNWILPQNTGGDIAYKPPLLHWCVAALYTVTGTVNEYLARVPSAVAFILLVWLTFRFFSRHGGVRRGLLAALLTLTAFEVHRAGNTCRVDMLLTLFIVWALYLLYNWHGRGCRGVPLGAVLCMSLGTLTKGPVAIVLPLFVTGCWLLWHRERRVTTWLKLACLPLLAMVLPALWYWAAYQQGGDQFLSLMLEENVGRFLGKMSYGSHEHSFLYNFLTLLTGWAPWTLLLPVLMAVALKRGKRRAGKSKEDERVALSEFHSGQQKGTGGLPARVKALLLHPDASAKSWAWLAFGLILLFYCIPSSKRSTYLLPCYPFMAYLLADVWVRVMRGPWRRRGRRWMVRTLVAVIAVFMVADGIVVPMTVKKKYDRPLAEYIQRTFPHDDLYSFVNVEYLHFFCTNFYLRDRLRQFGKAHPKKGVLMVVKKDVGAFKKQYGDRYVLQKVSQSSRRMTERKDTVCFYRFTQRSRM